jgi:spore coat polysaccharide biosynthesis protein SpsF
VISNKNPVIAVIQARMSSSRLPGKVLMPLGGRPLIWHIYQRALSCKKVDKVVIATSTEDTDDELVKFCKDNDLNFFRGELNNVLNRFLSIPNVSKYSYIVRITGDCPFIYPAYIDEQIRLLKKYNGDLIWSKRESSVLEGQGVLSLRSLEHIMKNTNNAEDYEHVGNPYIANNPDKFRIVEVKFSEKFLKYNFRLTIDEEKDYYFLRNIFKHFNKDVQINFIGLLKWLSKNNDISQMNKDVKHKKLNSKLVEIRNKWEIANKAGYAELEIENL